MMSKCADSATGVSRNSAKGGSCNSPAISAEAPRQPLAGEANIKRHDPPKRQLSILTRSAD